MSEEARRTLRYGEPLSEARTKLADFFSKLLVGMLFRVASLVSRISPLPGKPFFDLSTLY